MNLLPQNTLIWSFALFCATSPMLMIFPIPYLVCATLVSGGIFRVVKARRASYHQKLLAIDRAIQRKSDSSVSCKRLHSCTYEISQLTQKDPYLFHLIPTGLIFALSVSYPPLLVFAGGAVPMLGIGVGYVVFGLYTPLAKAGCKRAYTADWGSKYSAFMRGVDKQLDKEDRI